jgi:hypothetical protein
MVCACERTWRWCERLLAYISLSTANVFALVLITEVSSTLAGKDPGVSIASRCERDV